MACDKLHESDLLCHNNHIMLVVKLCIVWLYCVAFHEWFNVLQWYVLVCLICVHSTDSIFIVVIYVIWCVAGLKYCVMTYDVFGLHGVYMCRVCAVCCVLCVVLFICCVVLCKCGFDLICVIEPLCHVLSITLKSQHTCNIHYKPLTHHTYNQIKQQFMCIVILGIT